MVGMQFFMGEDFAINFVAGLIVMIIEIALIVLVVNRAIAHAQRRAEDNRWAGTRGVILAGMIADLRQINLLMLNFFGQLPIDAEDGTVDRVKAFAASPLMLYPSRIPYVLPDVERDVTDLRNAVSFANTAISAEWYKDIAELASIAGIVTRSANNIQTSRTYGPVAQLPDLSLEAVPETGFFASLNKAMTEMDTEELHIRFLRRLIVTVNGILLMNQAAERVARACPGEVRRRLRADKEMWQGLVQDRAINAAAVKTLDSYATALTDTFEAVGGDRAALKRLLIA